MGSPSPVLSKNLPLLENWFTGPGTPGRETNGRSVLVVYITPHGLGHAARTCDVLWAFRTLYPEVPVTVVSRLPNWFLTSRKLEVKERVAAFDVGIVQRDAVEMDIPATLVKLRDLMADWDALVRSEAEWLNSQKARLVVSDIPAIPLQAAALAGVPSVAVTSFSWDWIYSAFRHQDPFWQEVIEKFRNGYKSCPLLLRSPFSGPMKSFERVEDIRLVARPGEDRRRELAALTGADPRKPWLLFCLSHLEFQSPNCLAEFSDYQFLTAGDLNWEAPNCFSLDPKAHRFADLVASCQAVVTKPGFGILSDCAVNNKPIIYVEREGFLEYPILVDGIKRHLRGWHTPLQSLYRGKLGPALEAFSAGLPAAPEPLQTPGPDEVAHRLYQLMIRG